MSKKLTDTSSSSTSFHISQAFGLPTERMKGRNIVNLTGYLQTMQDVISSSLSASSDILRKLTGRQKTCTCRSCELGLLTRDSGRFASVKWSTGSMFLRPFR